MKKVIDGLTWIVNRTSDAIAGFEALAKQQENDKVNTANENKLNFIKEEKEAIKALAEEYKQTGLTEEAALKAATTDRAVYWEKNKKALEEQIKTSEKEQKRISEIIADSNPLSIVFKSEFNSMKAAKEAVVSWGNQIGDLKAQLISSTARAGAGSESLTDFANDIFIPELSEEDAKKAYDLYLQQLENAYKKRQLIIEQNKK